MTNKPQYGLKEHASVDVDNDFILATTISQPLVMIQTIFPIVPYRAVIPKILPKRYMPIKAIMEDQTGTFYL